MKLKTYTDFVNEQEDFNPQSNLQFKTAKNLDKLKKDYFNFKTAISSFWDNANSKPDESSLTPERISKELRKYTDNKGLFKNELLKFHWDICELSYQIKNKENEIEKLKKDIEGQKSILGDSKNNDTSKINEILKNMNDLMENKTKDIEKMKQKLLLKSKNMKRELGDYVLKTKEIKTELDKK
jgi:predicted  nucleic acid-binding Zn-ribbon protein